MPQFIWPAVAPLTQGYGLQPDGTFHPGVDIGTPVGTPIHASAIGTVSQAGAIGVGGNTVVIEDPGGYETVYADLGPIAVKVGDKINQGEVIALSDGSKSGSTPGQITTGPHTHFQIDKGIGAVHNINPLPLLPTSDPSNTGYPSSVTPASDKGYQNKLSILGQLERIVLIGPVGTVLSTNNPVSDAANKIPILGPALTATEVTAKIGNYIVNPTNWKRVGLGALGAVILLITVVKLTQDTPTGQAIKGAAMKAALA